jgi:LmbE family N-acetylglucosaminyl deacetylase
MHSLGLNSSQSLRRILCLGAHCDDIEIGCGATLMSLLERNPDLSVHWIVLSSSEVREREARASAADFLGRAKQPTIHIQKFRNGYFPQVWADIKDYMETLKTLRPDLIFTHHRGDFHQDHRTLGELTWNTWRDNLIFEYEIPKYDGDLGRPNAFMPVSATLAARKIELVMRHFASQKDKQWWSEETFRSIMRLRGVECAAPSGYAEAFFATKMSLSA